MSRLNRARTQLKRELSSYALAHGCGDARGSAKFTVAIQIPGDANGDDGMRSVATSERSRRE